jgi:Tfp pilus assembly protein PilX
MAMSSLKETGMRASRVSNERGIALAVAVFALVIIGALVAATFFAGRVEQQTGQNTMFAGQASEAAEAALTDALSSQSASSLTALVNDPTQVTDLGAFTGPSGTYTSATRTIRRLGDNLFLFEATGARVNGAGSTIATRTLGQLIRLNEVDITVNAGLTALGDVKVTGGAEVSGMDAVPPLWAAQSVSCPPTADAAGVRYNNGTVSTSGNGTVGGVPATVQDPTLNPTDMQNNFNQLKALATLTLTSNNPAATEPAYTGNPARCNAAIETNWGEPAVKTDPCFDYFPIIYHNGNLKLQGGRGQGILLVEGDLDATGGMVFYGPVFVTGTLSTSGNSGQGAKFFGGVIAGNVALDDLTKLAGGALVNFSSCALKRALGGSAKPAAFNERGWAQIY